MHQPIQSQWQANDIYAAGKDIFCLLMILINQYLSSIKYRASCNENNSNKQPFSKKKDELRNDCTLPLIVLWLFIWFRTIERLFRQCESYLFCRLAFLANAKRMNCCKRKRRKMKREKPGEGN